MSEDHGQRSAAPNDATSPIALVSSLHDPEGRLRPALLGRGAGLAGYGGVYVAATEVTDRRVLNGLRAHGAWVEELPVGSPGASQRAALRAADDAGHPAFLVCDFDRWLHWAGRFPRELAALPGRIGRRQSPAWYVCLGRTARAFATHPPVQRAAERATNHALSLAFGQRVDATAGAAWLARQGAEVVLAGSVEATKATDLEWPALVYRRDPRRVAYLATEGLEFETAEFYAAEIAAAGGMDAWVRATYERPAVWAERLRLATDSVAALVRVLG